MSVEAYYLLGTLAGWIGFGLLAASAAYGVRLFRQPTAEIRRDSILCLVGAAVLLLTARSVPMNLGRALDGTGVQIPLVWVYMHFWGWASLNASWKVVSGTLKIGMSVSSEERLALIYGLAAWGAVLALILG